MLGCGGGGTSSNAGSTHPPPPVQPPPPPPQPAPPPATGTVEISITDTVAAESAGTLAFSLALSAAADNVVSVDITTEPGTAVADSD